MGETHRRQRRTSDDGVKQSADVALKSPLRYAECMNERAEPEPTPFQRFDALMRRIIRVPKTEIEKREQQWREDRAKATAQKKREARH